MNYDWISLCPFEFGFLHRMKILIIRFSSIGDIVLTSPVIRCIKKQIPNAEIHYLTKDSYRDIIEYNPYITKKYYLQNDLSTIVSALKKEKYDFVLDLHNNQRSWLIKLMLRRRSDTFNKLNLEKWLLVNFKWNFLPDVHIVERYLEPVRRFGIRNDGKGLEYFIPLKDEVKMDELPLTHLHGFVAVVIGAKHHTKKLPLEKLAALCSLLPYPIILLGGPEDRDAGEKISITDPIKIFNGCGRYSLNQSASVIKQAKLVITHDTGLMHIAAAFKKKIISIWGNTIPQFGMYPYYGNEGAKKSQIVQVSHLYCRPCSKLGYHKCPKGHFKCMKQIDEQQVAEIASRL